MAEFTPELSQDTLDSLLRRINEQKQVDIASARGESVRRGLTGGSFEGSRVSGAERTASQSSADTAIQLALENATRLREERLIKEGRQYTTSEREASQQYGTGERIASQTYGTGERIAGQEFTSGQNLANRVWGTSERVAGQDFTAGEGAANRLFQTEAANTAEERAKSAAKRQGRSDLLGAGLGAAGMIMGGPVGGIVGGAVGKLFCFAQQTPIKMIDGTEMAIERIQLGDETKGGKVVSIRISIADDGTRFNYQGVVVTGSHAVFEDGKWVRVEDSKQAKSVDGGGIVWSLVTTDHRIYVNDIVFADEFEEGQFLTPDESLSLLNERKVA